MESAQATTERLQITAPSSSETAFSNVPKLVPPSAPIQLSSSTGPTPSTTLQATTPTPSAGALSPLAIAALSFSACAALFLAGISAYCCWLRRRRPKRPMVQSMAKASFLGSREAQEAWLHSPQSHSHAVAVACGDFQVSSCECECDG
ncbi:hypothetical protein BDR26DRAFT_939132 [Obelidium mucronatum]|nr:hypothetical protein BDR26DRAFT_939132 [Obelidium mucronatum]